eukprot:GHVU01154909.1.p1 GENE.GHVU01154909.1~~GHVU01154909.1.p1  ORF type:complete len:333 (+),score=35.30 GHVU01154909.1:106-1104(+)
MPTRLLPVQSVVRCPRTLGGSTARSAGLGHATLLRASLLRPRRHALGGIERRAFHATSQPPHPPPHAGRETTAGGSNGWGPAETGEGGADGKGSTHFGFRTVTQEEKTHLVGKLFSSVADRYDLMNDLMSGGLHRLWKCEFVKEIDIPQSSATTPTLGESYRYTILDVAGGTGDIALRIARKAQDAAQTARDIPRIIVCDINEQMMGVGKRRAAEAGHSAFGLRNFSDLEAGLREAHRVLRKGGRFLCLEFSRVETPIVSQLYDFYSFNVIPSLGKLVTGDPDSYQYLVESIRKFPDEQEFATLMSDAGFKHVTYSPMTFNVASIHSGFKLD